MRPDYDRIQDPAGLIPADEPVLLIRGQDRCAIGTALRWAAENDAHGGDPLLSRAAREHAEAIRLWQDEHGSKVADIPAEARSVLEGAQPQ